MSGPGQDAPVTPELEDLLTAAERARDEAIDERDSLTERVAELVTEGNDLRELLAEIISEFRHTAAGSYSALAAGHVYAEWRERAGFALPAATAGPEHLAGQIRGLAIPDGEG